jgi:hypothetical protein
MPRIAHVLYDARIDVVQVDKTGWKYFFAGEGGACEFKREKRQQYCHTSG